MHWMRIWSAALFVALSATAPHAASAHRKDTKEETNRQLLRLELGTRMEQRCNGRASRVTMRDNKLHAPDETTAYAFADVRVHGAFVEAPGAAIRDGGKWYHLSYKCQTTSDGLEIVSFEYKLGSLIPRNEWAAHELVN